MLPLSDNPQFLFSVETLPFDRNRHETLTLSNNEKKKDIFEGYLGDLFHYFPGCDISTIAIFHINHAQNFGQGRQQILPVLIPI